MNGTINSKLEFRNPKQITKDPNEVVFAVTFFSEILISCFEVVSSFERRHSRFRP